MATYSENVRVRPEDLVPIGSRVSWGATLAGAVLALAVYFVLTLLGGAIGLSVAGSVRGGTLAVGAAIWAVITTLAALFVGGWFTSQATVGENKVEAAAHGVLMWGVVFALLVWAATAGVQAGFSGMVGVAGAVRTADGQNWEAMAREAGFSQQQIDDFKRRANQTADEARATATDPARREQAAENAAATATAATWWTLLGTILSMGAAIAGALVGAGPTFHLFGTEGRRVAVDNREPALR